MAEGRRPGAPGGGRRLPLLLLGWLLAARGDGGAEESEESLPSGQHHGGAPEQPSNEAATVPAGESVPRGQLAPAPQIVSPWRANTPEALRAEIIAAEEALALRAEVDGSPVVYDSPSVSISLRKVSPDVLVKAGTELESADGAKVKIPADPRIKGRHGGPVTVSVTSYHAGEQIKELPTVRYGAHRQTRRAGGAGAPSRQSEDRVDFFMSKTSVSWRGTVNVKVPGLGAEVPAHDRPWKPYGEAADVHYQEEKQQLREEVEGVAALPSEERLRAFRRLAKRWHPDKNPGDVERATEVFSYLQELRELLLGTIA